MKIYETYEVVRYLRKRNTLKTNLKAKAYFEAWHAQMIHLKLLKPKQQKEYQFRINNKYFPWILQRQRIFGNHYLRPPIKF